MSKWELGIKRKLSSCNRRPLGLWEWNVSMKQIKLSGREMAVLRAIDYASGSTGIEIRDKTAIDGADVAEILNALSEVGYVETFPYVEPITFLNYAETRFEVNPSYAMQLKAAMKRY